MICRNIMKMFNWHISQAVLVLTLLQCVQLSFQMEMNYTHRLYIDNDKRYHLSWTFDDKEIVFEAIVNTSGYVGFGFSPDGTMANADVVIGEVKNRKPSLKDYYGLSNGTLVEDIVSNWMLLSGDQMYNQIKLIFKRRLITDDPNDVDITSDTTRVMWAYGEETFDVKTFMVRGYKSLRLLQVARPNLNIPEDAEKLLITMNKILLPNKATTYLCRDFELPKYNQKMHIIQISPVVTKGNEFIVHHMLLYSCQNNTLKRKLGEVHLCYDENLPDIWEKCPMVVFGWAIGGSNFPLPGHVGIPIEVSTDPVAFLLEIHYDNPEEKSGVLDSSGFEMIVTSARRKFDGAIIEIGQIPFDPAFRFIQMIPPYQEQFKSNSICLSKCIYEDYPPKDETVVMKIFAVLLHAHLIAKQIVLHHYRNGKEIDNIASDRKYDFNYQEMVFLNKEIEILRGDDLKVECVYNSMERSKFTWGGLSTSDEMCLAYVMYYPKMRTTNCLSAIGVDDTNWIEYNLHPSNLWQFKKHEIAKKFELTVNGVGRNSSLLTYCSDGINTTVRYQPAGNIFNILRNDYPRTTDTPIRTTHPPPRPTVTPIRITDVTSKAGSNVVNLYSLPLELLLLEGLVLYLIGL